jgi:hypothetical protein
MPGIGKIGQVSTISVRYFIILNVSHARQTLEGFEVTWA